MSGQTAHTSPQTSFWTTMQSSRNLKEFVPNFRDQQVSSNLKKLILFSLSIIALPLSSMVVAKKYVFEGVMGMSNADALLYSAILAVVLVHIVLFGFVYAAWNDDEGTPKTKAQMAAEKID